MRTTNRPIFLNIASIRLPIPGIVSILHHISSVLLLAILPLLLWLFSGTMIRADAFVKLPYIRCLPAVKNRPARAVVDLSAPRA